MADFDNIVRSHAGADGNIPAEAITKLVKAISTAVGNEFVEKSRYKAKLEEIDTLTAEKQTAEDSATTAGKWKDKYDALKTQFDDYKQEQANKETHAAKEQAMRGILTEIGIAEKRRESVLKLCDVDSIELNEKGEVKGRDKLAGKLKEEWADFITTTETHGANTANPPTNTGGGKMTKEDIFKIKDASERQRAIAENHELFGIN